jgi:predicted ATPase/GAF domain-containing protein/tRNA A-37 threonylcarbamoyl transferase component Bud32
MLVESPIVATSPVDGFASAVLIQEGTETVVYRARAVDTGASVILKLTKSEYPTAKELARLRREFGILRELDLPVTPKAHALQGHGHGLALIMADLGPCTLHQLLESRRIGVEDTLRIAISLSDVLSEVHRRHIIHKDVTPRNIIVHEPTLEARLIDFGISARLAQEMQSPGGLKGLEGTLVYIAPEQTGRMNRAVDLRADLYSLGVVLYEMLTGVVPFLADSSGEIIHSHLARRATPPHEQDPSVPAPLSDIVMMLLAKTPEERYQSDAGLRADLGHCLEQWRATKSIAPFPLRRHDKATELRRTQKLYGREGDIEALLQAFERACVRGPELMLVSGYSGVGKSALVNEIHKLTAHRGGYFVAGKFDQISRDAPLAPVVRAFRELILQLLTESPESLSGWRSELLEALGENGRLLTDLVPELGLIIGTQPEVPALSADQARNRFELTLQRFLDVFAERERPLVIFLDDLQWIDAASLKLLKLLLVDAYSEHMLIIGTYRDNEVQPGHPLLSMLDELERAGLRATDLHLGPLDPQAALSLVADTLTSRPDEVSELAELVYEKTQGNPFFAHQFMAELNEGDLLRFDAGAGAWRWDIARIRDANVADNVVDLMVSKLQRLAPATRQAVMLASCVGHHFDLRSLSIIGEKSMVETAAALWEAMREGFVVPLDGDYRLVEGAEGSATTLELPADFNVRYRFLHDRILHAAYSLIAPDRKQQLHLAIGRLLRRSGGDSPRDADLLEIVRHLNLGAKGITDHAEGMDLAQLDLRAGQRAKAATAYSAAADYLRAGIALLGDAGWESAYELSLALHMEAAECDYLSGDVEGAKALFGALMPQTKTDIERASVYRMRSRTLYSLSQSADALAIGGEGLLSLGHPWDPEEIHSQATFMSELALVQTNLGGRRVEDLIHAPEIQDPKLRAVLELLETMILPAYQIPTYAFPVMVLKSVNFSLKHGHTAVSAYPYAACAYILANLLDRVSEGLPFSTLALDLNKKFPNAMQLSRINVCLGFLIPMRYALRDAGPYLKAGQQTGLESGDFSMMAIACFQGTLTKLGAGDQLEDVLENADKNLVQVRRIKEFMLPTMTIVRQAVAALMGRTRARATLSDESFSEEEYLGRLDDTHYGNSKFHYHVLKLQIHHLYGEYTEAMAAGEAAEQRIIFCAGVPHTKLLSFYRCMVILALPPAETPEEAGRRSEILSRHRAQMEVLAANSPEGFEHMKVLIDAEAARVSGDVPLAIRLYEQAIHLSYQRKAPHIEAMACELGGKFFLSIGAQKAASAYITDAYRAYLHWGALPKAEALEAEYARVLPALRVSAERAKSKTTASTSLTHTNSTILSRTSMGSLRDAALVLRAAQTIAGETDLPKVIERLSALVLENAGAQRGALILSREGELVVSTVFGDTASAVDDGHGKPLDESDDIARSAVRYVARTLESVVVDDTGAMTRFSEDPYIRGGAPKSLLCLPLLHQGRLIGVLYLENRATAGVFDVARVELLALLSSQAAIAIENARLISSVRTANREVERANERLELTVAHRTEELVTAKERLELELSRREQIERERTALQEQVIDTQRARLAEMSTPLIPITDEIMVMPLIGTLDRERATQVLTAALEGAQRHRARVVILDITGVQQIDTDVAGTLLGVYGALRMIGTEAVLTGIAPNIAQTVVGLGVDLSSFVTLGTLQSGMEYALRRVRGSGALRARGRP